MSGTRWQMAAWLLLGSAWAMQAWVHQPAVPPARPLTQFPLELGPWHGTELPLTTAVLQDLELHDYLNRVYVNGAGQGVGLYIAYYPQQQFGDDIHSPKNCLPGSGWEPISSQIATLPVRGQAIRVNQYLIARGPDRALVLYWYQQNGRVVASEYWSKADQVWDGLVHRRSDAALVRVAVSANNLSATAAAALGAGFVARVFPNLDSFIPR